MTMANDNRSNMSEELKAETKMLEEASDTKQKAEKTVECHKAEQIMAYEEAKHNREASDSQPLPVIARFPVNVQFVSALEPDNLSSVQMTEEAPAVITTQASSLVMKHNNDMGAWGIWNASTKSWYRSTLESGAQLEFLCPNKNRPGSTWLWVMYTIYLGSL